MDSVQESLKETSLEDVSDPRKHTALEDRSQTDATIVVEPEGPVGDDSTSKLTYVFGLLRKFVGVKDLVQLRISLPAHLMEPQSNLEFWNYNDRPDIFVSISEPDDPLLRFTNVLRWWFSRDTKWKDNQLRKPFNPILGEQFLCQWKVEPLKPFTTADIQKNEKQEEKTENKTMTIHCITEQISHHPPVSAFYYSCDEAGVIARGIDHVIAKFTGTTFKVGPGDLNHGIYITLPNRDDEEYNLTHPWATVNGLLMGKPYIVVSESTIVVCPKTGLKAILEYKDEPMFGRPKFEVVGKIFRYDYSQEVNLTEKERKEKNKLKSVKEDDVVAILSGQWNGKVFISFRLDLSFMKSDARVSTSSRNNSDTFSEPVLLFDLTSSDVIPKIVRPVSEQTANESGRVWEKVIDALVRKDYSAANIEKRKVEERQRLEARERETENGLTEIPYEPTYFKYHDLKEHHRSQGKPGPPVDMELGKPYLKDDIATLFN